MGFTRWQWYFKKTQCTKTHIKTPWPESASELYRPSDHRLLAKLVLTFAVIIQDIKKHNTLKQNTAHKATQTIKKLITHNEYNTKK
jgi:hypothetical protein